MRADSYETLWAGQFEEQRVHRGSHLRRRAMLACAVVAIALVASACVPPPPSPPTVIFYGDSLLSSSSGAITNGITAQRPGWEVVTRSFGGTALCDWLDSMRGDGDLNAKVVVIEFVGNSLTPCMGSGAHPAMSPGWYSLYSSAANEAASIWAARGVKVLFASAPRGVCSAPPAPLDGIYQQAANAWGATFSAAPSETFLVSTGTPPSEPTTTTTSTASTTVTTAPPEVEGAATLPPMSVGSSVLAAMDEVMVQAEGSWPCTDLGDPPPPSIYGFEMPCLPDETLAMGCVNGLIQVREGTAANPGGHFCPVSVSQCPMYSSGVRRFSDAIVAATVPLMV
ncbi:MAG: hypothetical protein FJW86_07900 [Actinobacteria bacterium]|nr:hypothetical protein [Actinomycetota bacterium]